jgi:glycosyltransferase involved in cell wall biosynthesis
MSVEKRKAGVMRIFFIGYELNKDSGGMQRYYTTLLDYLSGRGYSFYTYTYMPDSPINPSVRHIGRIGFIDKYPSLLCLRLACLLKFHKIQHIICGHMFLTPIVDKICGMLGLEYTLSTHGTECWANYFRKYTKYQRHLKKIMIVSNFSKNQLIEQGVSEDKIFHAPGVIDPDKFVAQPAKKESNKFILLTVCRHDSSQGYKGCDAVIQAMPMIRSRVPEAEYWIVGKGDDLPRLERLAREYALKDSVKFLGFLPFAELVSTYAACDLFIMPSRVSLDPEKVEGEGLGIVFLEAGIMGKPLIGPNEGGSLDVIQDGYNGFNVDPTNHREIAERVIRLAQDAFLRKTMGENARQVVLKKYTIAQLPEYLESLFPYQEPVKKV